MRRVRVWLACMAGLFVWACSAGQPALPNADERKFVTDHATELDGVWVSDGYGYAITKRGKSLAFYHITPEVCIPVDVSDTSLSDIFDRFRYGKRRQDGIGRALLLSTSTEPHEYVFHRRERLPHVCQETVDSSHAATIEAVISYMATHYAFFEKRGVDWDAAAKRLRNAALTLSSEEELFDAFVAELSAFDDAHVELEAVIDGETKRFDADPGIIRDYVEDKAAAHGITPRQAWAGLLDEFWVSGVGESILAGKGHSAGNDRIRFGMASDRTGYLALRSMGGFVEDAEDPLSEAQSLDLALDRAIALFNREGASSVIVDLSINSGGYDYISRQLVERFTKEPTFAYSFYPFDADEVHEFQYTLRPSAKERFTGPVFVLTSDASVSAAELAVMCFDALDHATIVGESTRGALSTKLAKQLPNGWALMLSNQVYFDNRGEMVETVGVQPSLLIPVFPDEDVIGGHKRAVAELLAHIRYSAPIVGSAVR